MMIAGMKEIFDLTDDLKSRMGGKCFGAQDVQCSQLK